MSVKILYLIICAIAATAHGKPSNYNYVNATLPEDCKKNYCFTKTQHYPTELIDSMLVDLDNSISVDTDTTTKRIGDDIDSNDCEKNSYYQPIYQIIDENDRVRYVVQSKKFKQVLRVEECMLPGRLTTDSIHFTDTQLQYIHLACEETYLDYAFLVLSLDSTKIESVKTKGGIPVSCACKVRRL
ncbi:uncharacterized protein LOC113514053 [Galleria mellonella]|uniref:Uncharacterized protein LOC113514053 n=1 Tax=Galleria mellonella TaxID=7137 RepID=A0A6J1WHQ5_GALME|nr:uncharacterized protein LOC113514053 [Galleria mellonella]